RPRLPAHAEDEPERLARRGRHRRHARFRADAEVAVFVLRRGGRGWPRGVPWRGLGLWRRLLLPRRSLPWWSTLLWRSAVAWWSTGVGWSALVCESGLG